VELLFAFPPAGGAQPVKKVRIGSTTPSITTLPAELAARKGFFRQEGLEPEIIIIRSADIIVKALLTNNLDYATPLPSLVAAAMRGLPIRVIGVMIKKTSYVLVSHPSIRSIADLKGKVIGVSSFGGASDYAVRAVLQKRGLDSKRDVTIIQVGGSSSRLGALQGGTIQATVLVAPFNIQAERSGYRTLLWLGEVIDLPQGGLGTHDDRIKQQPDEVVSVLKATVRGIQFVKTQKTETVSFMKEWLGVDAGTAEATYPLLVDSMADYGIVEDSVLQSAVDANKFQFRFDRDVPMDEIRNWKLAMQARQELTQKPTAK
jgi:NitT/TauT family transport system substrate-binding protein